MNARELVAQLDYDLDHAFGFRSDCELPGWIETVEEPVTVSLEPEEIRSLLFAHAAQFLHGPDVLRLRNGALVKLAYALYTAERSEAPNQKAKS